MTDSKVDSYSGGHNANIIICKFKLPSKVDKLLPIAHIIYTSQFRIHYSEIRSMNFGIRNSEFEIVK